MENTWEDVVRESLEGKLDEENYELMLRLATRCDKLEELVCAIDSFRVMLHHISPSGELGSKFTL